MPKIKNETKILKDKKVKEIKEKYKNCNLTEIIDELADKCAKEILKIRGYK